MIGKAVARAMVAPFRCLPPFGGLSWSPLPRSRRPRRVIATAKVDRSCRNRTRNRGAIEVTASSHRVDGVVSFPADEVQEAGLVRVFVGRTASGGAPSQAPRGTVASALDRPAGGF